MRPLPLKSIMPWHSLGLEFTFCLLSSKGFLRKELNGLQNMKSSFSFFVYLRIYFSKLHVCIHEVSWRCHILEFQLMPCSTGQTEWQLNKMAFEQNRALNMSWGRPIKEGLILVGKDVEPRIGLLVNHAFAEKGVGEITWLSFGSDVGKSSFCDSFDRLFS
jgi:hypothetical protein